MSAQNPLPDQADVLAQLTQKTADLATAKQTIGSLSGQVTSLTAEKTNLESQLAEANGKVAQLQRDLTKLTGERDTFMADNARLTGEMADFNKRLATDLAKHGIRTFGQNATSAVPETVAGRKTTATEKLLAVRGVQTLDQLAQQKKS